MSRQRSYLRRVVQIVADSEPTLPIAAGTLEALAAAVQAAYPGYGHSVFLRVGLPAEYRRQARLAEAEDLATGAHP